MNMYLAFIIHDISGIRSKETEGSKQAACGSSNVHRCTDEAGSLAPPPPLAAAKRSDVDIQSPSWHDSSPLNFSSATFPALDLITHLVQIHSIAVKYILSEKGRYIVWTSGLLLPCALCAAPATGTRRRMMRARPATGTRRRTLLCEVTIDSICKCFVFFFHPLLRIKSKTIAYR